MPFLLSITKRTKAIIRRIEFFLHLSSCLARVGAQSNAVRGKKIRVKWKILIQCQTKFSTSTGDRTKDRRREFYFSKTIGRKNLRVLCMLLCSLQLRSGYDASNHVYRTKHQKSPLRKENPFLTFQVSTITVIKKLHIMARGTLLDYRPELRNFVLIFSHLRD